MQKKFEEKCDTVLWVRPSTVDVDCRINQPGAHDYWCDYILWHLSKLIKLWHAWAHCSFECQERRHNGRHPSKLPSTQTLWVNTLTYVLRFEMPSEHLKGRLREWVCPSVSEWVITFHQGEDDFPDPIWVRRALGSYGQMLKRPFKHLEAVQYQISQTSII